MHATPVSFPPPAIARAKLVVLGCAGGVLHRIVDSVRSLQEFDYVCADRLVAADEESLVSRLRHWFWGRKGGRGFLLDGFPAHALQAMMFDQWLDGRDESLTACLMLERSWSQTRGSASRGVAEYFRAQGLLYQVDGTESPEAVLGGLSQLVADR